MSGKLYGIGVGPGDPELITLKSLRILRSSDVIFYIKSEQKESFARSIVAQYLNNNQLEIPIVMPMRSDQKYGQIIYDEACKTIKTHLDLEQNIVFLCEGDPFFYGSFMYIYQRLKGYCDIETVPGISSIMASASVSGRWLASRNDVFSTIPATLPDQIIKAQLETASSVAIIKLGRHYERVKLLLKKMDLEASSTLIENVTLENQVCVALKDAPNTAPYFSLILVYTRNSEHLNFQAQHIE
jgi:precorrin-2/cobalt-factor-2 C20-methyltransferase